MKAKQIAVAVLSMALTAHAEPRWPKLDSYQSGAEALEDHAVIISIDQKQGLMAGCKRQNAKADADAFADFLIATEGVHRSNIIRMQDPMAHQVEGAFEKISKAIKGKRSQGRMWVYYAGCSAGVTKGGASYLLTSDSTQPSKLAKQALNLGKLQSGAYTKKFNKKTYIIVDAEPLPAQKGLTSAKAVQSSVTSLLWVPKGVGEMPYYSRFAHTGLSPFTYAVIAGLRGWADGVRYDETDGSIASDELHAFTADLLKDDALKSGSPQWIGVQTSSITRVHETMPILSYPDYEEQIPDDPKEVESSSSEWVPIPESDVSMPDGTVEHVKMFEMMRHEVTVEEYKRCVKAALCTPPPDSTACNYGQRGRAKHPMNCVTYQQAQEYAQYAHGRIPTEAEWLAAAHPKGWNYPWGDIAIDCDHAVLFGKDRMGCQEERSWPVCSKTEGLSPSKVCDLVGNVEEWTSSVAGEHRKDHVPSKVKEKSKKSKPPKITLGSSYRDDATTFGVTHSMPETYVSPYLGFRLVR